MSGAGERIRRARLARVPRMTLAELAGDRLSISLISKIERGLVQPSLATLEYLAQRLGLSPGDLVGAGGSDASPVERALRLARARVAIAVDDPDRALSELGDDQSGEAALVRARAMLALRRDDEALDAIERVGGAAALLLRAEVSARRGPDGHAQEAYARALAAQPASDHAARAEAMIGLARVYERQGAATTAHNLFAQALRELASAASADRRRDDLVARADALAAAGDAVGAGHAAAAAAALAELARAASLRAELASQVSDQERRAPPAVSPPSTRYRDAGDAMAHRSIRPPREE